MGKCFTAHNGLLSAMELLTQQFKSLFRSSDGWLKPTSFYLTLWNFLAPGRFDFIHLQSFGLRLFVSAARTVG